MSYSNVELIDRLFTLSNRRAIGDGKAMSELLAAYHRSADVGALLELPRPEDGTTEDLVRSYFERIGRTCYVWYAYADELQEHGDSVLALGRDPHGGEADPRRSRNGRRLGLRDP